MNDIEDSLITAAGCLIITNDNKILAFARKGNRNKLGLPCGKREYGESIDQTAIREVEEEVGFKVKLKGDESVFCIIPDDKSELGLNEYCATFIVSIAEFSDQITFSDSNLSGDGVPEGFGLWVTPQDFIHASNSAFYNYNSRLLAFAGI